MIPARVIEAKRDGGNLPPRELASFLEGYMRGDVAEAQLAAFLMASFYTGLSNQETDTLLDAMVRSGATLAWASEQHCVDKHSTGGVGDKVSLVLAPLVAALGVAVPMMSGRGLGHTGGTLDKLAAIPGFRTQLSLEEFRSVVERVGCAMIGQTSEIAPLDGRIYALRDITGTVPIPQVIAASIMSKKIAEGVSGLLLDVKVGPGAIIPEEERALELAEIMVGLGEARGLRTRAILTAMDRPLGVKLGNALETEEAIECLRGGGPPDLRSLVLREAAEMLVLAHGDEHTPSTLAEWAGRAEIELDNGSALEKFAELVEAQGGDSRVCERPDLLPRASEIRDVFAQEAGGVEAVEPRPFGEGVVVLGGGRRRARDEIDLAVGFEVVVSPGDRVASSDLLGRVHAQDPDSLEFGEAVLRGAVRLAAEGAQPGSAGRGPSLRPMVSHVVDASGVHDERGVRAPISES